MSQTFDALVTAKPEITARTADLDLTDLFPEAGEQVLFTYRELMTPELFRIPEMADAIQFQQPGWAQPLCQKVAILSVCHVAPASKMHLGILYANLVDRLTTEQFASLVNRFMGAFPELQDFAASVSAEKNDSTGRSSASITPA